MSMLVPGEPRIQDVIDAARGPIKCRIPQRLPPGRTRPPSTSISIPRTRANYSDPTTRQKYDMPSLNTRFCTKITTRPRSDEHTRPKSANRLKDEIYSNRQAHSSPRPFRPNERMPLKRPSTLPRKTNFESQKARPIIMVPIAQQKATKMNAKNPCCLPDQLQETITRHEDRELRHSDTSDNMPVCNDRSERESLSSQDDKLMQLKINWQDKMVQFEKMKNDLSDQQKSILELYAAMRDTQQKMSSLGEQANLPPAEDLRIMNVAKMTPEQLLQLCAGDDINNIRDKHKWECKTSLTIDVNKLYEMPTKLVDTCEETLAKRKEIIDWFKSLTSEEKGISVNKLSKKINEFNAENEMLKCTLNEVKAEFLKELEEIVSLVRKGINDTMALQLRTEELTYEMSELNSQNTDLRKQIHNADHLRSQTNKTRVEELEKELKEEKCKRLFMRDRLSRSEGQVKMNMERASQLEATLEQARSQIWSLERTVQQLHEQNQKLQNDFDKELNKLTDSIRDHTVHLEEIADAREKLQSEKEDLETRLTELSLYYNESLKSIKQEMNINVAKLIETEKKCEERGEDKKRLEVKLESLCTQLLEAELRHNNILQQLHEKETQLEKEIETHKELEMIKRDLEKSNVENIAHRERLAMQNEAIKEIERSFKEAIDSAESFKCELSTKNQYIAELEKKQVLLEQQLQKNESKMEAYVEQLSSLKMHINQLQEDFGEFDNLNDLHEMINQQRAKLLEATRQNGELAEALQKKDKELEQYSEGLTEHEHLLLEREGVIKMLSEKEVEQTNIIKILRNNLELRSQADNDVNQQLMDKNTEIDSLIVNLETRKQQISNMEKIILTLEDQTRKASIQRRKDQDHVMLLQKKITEYESFHMEATRMDTPENLDSLIKILEDELGTPMAHELSSKEHGYNLASKKKFLGDRKRDKLDCHENNNPHSHYHSEPDSFPTKIVMGNFVKKTYIPTNDEKYMGDNLGRKKAITNIETQKWIAAPEPGINVYAPSSPKENMPNLRRLIPGQPQNTVFTRNLQYLNPDQQRDNRKYKMFKLAGHRL